MDITQIIGTIGLVTSLFVNIPQAIKIIRNKRAEDVSIETYYLLLITVCCYLVRAIYIREYIFIISNSCAILVCLVIIFSIKKYRKQMKNGG